MGGGAPGGMGNGFVLGNQIPLNDQLRFLQSKRKGDPLSGCQRKSLINRNAATCTCTDSYAPDVSVHA